MRAGKLQTPLLYQTKSQTKDSYNQPQDTWTTVGTYFGWVRTPNGREAQNALQLKAEVSHMITLRYPGSFTFDPTGRFLRGARVFNILYAVVVDERSRQIDCMCTEVVKP